jgi:hypothetical protein
MISFRRVAASGARSHIALACPLSNNYRFELPFKRQLSGVEFQLLNVAKWPTA